MTRMDKLLSEIRDGGVTTCTLTEFMHLEPHLNFWGVRYTAKGLPNNMVRVTQQEI